MKSFFTVLMITMIWKRKMKKYQDGLTGIRIPNANKRSPAQVMEYRLFSKLQN